MQRLLVALDRPRGRVLVQLVAEELSLQVQAIRLGVVAAPLGRGLHLRDHLGGLGAVGGLAQQPFAQLLHHRLRDVVLHGEDVVELAVVRLRPQRLVLRRLDELGGDAHALSSLAHAAGQHVGDLQLLRRRRHVDLLALEGAGRRARRHAKALDLGQHVEQFLGQPVGEVLVLLVVAHVDERQHRDRRDGLLRRQPSAAPETWIAGWMDQLVEDLRLREILERKLAQRDERGAFGQGLAAGLARGDRDERLPAVAGVHHARDTIERRAEIVPLAEFRRARMQSHPDANDRASGPRLRAERLLCRQRRGDAVRTRTRKRRRTRRRPS